MSLRGLYDFSPTAHLRRESGMEARKANDFAQGVYVEVHDRSEIRA